MINQRKIRKRRRRTQRKRPPLPNNPTGYQRFVKSSWIATHACKLRKKSVQRDLKHYLIVMMKTMTRKSSIIKRWLEIT